MNCDVSGSVVKAHITMASDSIPLMLLIQVEAVTRLKFIYYYSGYTHHKHLKCCETKL